MLNRLLHLCLLLSFIDVAYSQDLYLLDSVSTLQFSSNSPSDLTLTKYHYDDDLRIIKTLSKREEVIFEYFGEHDYTATTRNILENIITYQNIKQFYQTGHLKEQEIRQPAQLLGYITGYRKYAFEYDEQNNTTKASTFNFSHSTNDYYLHNDITYTYEMGLLTSRITTNYKTDGTINFATEIHYKYENENLVLLVYYGNSNTTFNNYEYNVDNSLHSIYSLTLSNSLDTIKESLHEFKYTDEGQYQIKDEKYHNVVNANYKHEWYESNSKSLFYELDTSTYLFTEDSSVLSNKTYINSERYSPCRDSAFVRKQFHVRSTSIEDLRIISKEIHIRVEKEDGPILQDQSEIAHIYPNPVQAGSTVIVQRFRKNIDGILIYNQIGQIVQQIENCKNMQDVIFAPDFPGTYFLVFQSGGKPIGKIKKMVVL